MPSRVAAEETSPSTGPEQPASVTTVEITPGEASLSAGNTTRLPVTLRDQAGRVLTGRNDAGQLGKGVTSAPAAVNSVPSLVQGQRPL